MGNRIEKYRNNSSEEVLFILLRIILGKKEPRNLPSDVNWQDVYKLSLRQGVGAIACDGMLKLQDCVICEDLRYKWVGQSMVIENKARVQWNLVCELADLFARNGVKTIVLKGFSYASYYYDPFHRASSDIDIWLRGDYEKGNQIVENMGIKVDSSGSKHSHFDINGISVENHRFCVGVRGNNRNKKLERYLRTLLDKNGNYIYDSMAIKPEWLFNAIFFMCHARNHFLIGECISLKYICDWIVLRDCNDEGKDIEKFWLECDSLGLSQFAKIIDEIANYVIKKGNLSEMGARVLNDILDIKTQKTSHIKLFAHMNMLKRIWANRWKYKYFSDTSAIGMMMSYIWGYLFDRKPEL